MGFGGNRSSTSKTDITNATKPYNFNFGTAGNLDFSGGTGTYFGGPQLQAGFNLLNQTNPMVNEGLQFYNAGRRDNRDTEVLTGANRKLSSMIGSLPDSLNINDMYDNPFTNDMLSTMTRGLDRRQSDSRRQLQSDLNARGQLGSSYAAYRQSLQDQDFNQAYSQQEAQARQYGANAYMQNLNYGLSVIPTMQNVLTNYLNQLGGIQRLGSQGMQDYFYPAQIATQMMSPLSQLQSARVGGLTSLAQIEQQGNGRGSSLLSSILPAALGIGASFIPGVGPAVAPAVSGLSGAALGGGSPNYMTTDGLMALRAG